MGVGCISFSRRSSWPRDWTQVSRIVDRRFTVWATREVSYIWNIERVNQKSEYSFFLPNVFQWLRGPLIFKNLSFSSFLHELSRRQGKLMAWKKLINFMATTLPFKNMKGTKLNKAYLIWRPKFNCFLTHFPEISIEMKLCRVSCNSDKGQH